MIKILIFIGILFVNQSNADDCKRILRELANIEGQFSYCVTMHSVPVNICVGCRDKYDWMVANFTELKNTSNCTAEYFDKDRVNLVSATEESLTKLWTKAYCDDCYRNDNLETFNNLSTAFEGCIGQHKNDPCASCLLEYKDLNNFYLQMDDRSNGQVCFDLQDSMNRTRKLWSKELKCCRREFNMTMFTVVLGLISALPILFYSGTYFVTKWQERRGEMLYDDDPLVTRPTSSSSRTGTALNIPNNPVASSSGVLVDNGAGAETENDGEKSTNKSNSPNNFNKLQEDPDSSDNEVLTKPKYC
ncbi:osteopetrosis-associated transmembrane protein 1 [Musca autumnalis]|uniref:osteopetrosis-associated transmembrane protein 1 n=1 Tax=Musca autumnalis TaxID=221902 RepID=UPI003CE72C8F